MPKALKLGRRLAEIKTQIEEEIALTNGRSIKELFTKKNFHPVWFGVFLLDSGLCGVVSTDFVRYDALLRLTFIQGTCNPLLWTHCVCSNWVHSSECCSPCLRCLHLHQVCLDHTFHGRCGPNLQAQELSLLLDRSSWARSCLSRLPSLLHIPLQQVEVWDPPAVKAWLVWVFTSLLHFRHTHKR